MNGITRLFLAALVAGVFAFGLNPGHAFSQETMQLTGTEKVTHLGTYLYSEQKFSTQTKSHQQQETIFDNTNQTGGFLPPNQVGKTPPVEFLDWGQSNGGTIDGFQIGYATSDTGQISLKMKFYHGTDDAGNGAEIASFELTGLPGSTTGAIEIITYDVDISDSTFTLPPGKFGYGYVINDSLTGPLTADGGTGITDFYRLPPSLTNMQIAAFFAQFYMQLYGALLPFYIVNNTGGNGDGTFLNPFNNLSDAERAAVIGAAIFIYAGNGEYNGGFAMKDGQRLLGEGVGLTYGGQVVVPPGKRPVITNSTGNGIDLANDIYVAGLDIVDPLGSGIYGIGVGGFNSFGDISLMGGHNGIFVDKSSGVFEFGKTSISYIDSFAVCFRDSCADVTFKRLDIDSTLVGVKLDSLHGRFAITGDGTPGSGGSIQNVGESFFFASNAVQINLASLSLVSVEPIEIGSFQVNSFFDVTTTIDFEGLAVDVPGSSGSNFCNSANNSLSKNSDSLAGVVLTNSSFTGAAGVNISVGGTAAAEIELTDNTITTTADSGLTVQTSDSSTALVTLTNNDVSAAVNDFVLAQDSSSTFQLAGFAGGDAAAVAAFIQDNNVGTPTVAVSGSISADPTTSVEESDPAVIPSAFRLEQNYPNPFNPTTTIQFDLPRQSEVTLSIYNLNGQLVRTLVAGKFTAGNHSVVWDGRDARARQVTSGLYVTRMQAGEVVQHHKMLLIK
ncbi:MAG: FlgD immunoglobulin-like domain containing protein [bacterium]